MSRTPPTTPGCYHASAPSTTWEAVPCAPASTVPFIPAASANGRGPHTVGGGGSGDFSALVSGTSKISSSEGSFPIVIGLTTATPNNYSLQLNANNFTTSLCGSRAGCQGWEQFIYSTAVTGGSVVLIQNGLLNYGVGCPSNWTQPPASTSCYINSTLMPAPLQPITNLHNLTLTGKAGITDSAILSTGDGQLYVSVQAGLLNLSDGWTSAEFNVFGDGNGTQVAFNTGTTIAVQTRVATFDGSTAKPTCQASSITGETNNLTIVPNSCFATGGSAPGVWFTESNNPGASALPLPPTRAVVNGATVSPTRYSGAVEVTTAIGGNVCKSGDCPVGFCYWTTLHGPFWASTQGDVSLAGRGTSLAITTIPATASSPELWGVRYTGNVTGVPITQAAPYLGGGTAECTTFESIPAIATPDASCGSTLYSYADSTGTHPSGSTSFPAAPSVPALTGFIGNVAQASSWHASTGAPIFNPDKLNVFPGSALTSNRTPPSLQPSIFPAPPFTYRATENQS